jgi:hypothetical protein
MTDASELKSYPITDLLKFERREELVRKLFFKKGVTTIATPSGGGKTTAFFCLGLYVSIALWGAEEIEQRPLFWIAGEDQIGLRPLLEAWMEENPDCIPDARFVPEAVDFANPRHIDWLIKHLEGKPRPLIMADALSDILTVQGLKEDKSEDVTKVYKGIWRVVNALDASFGVLHHQGWVERRERGSSAIRDNSDILVKINKFDPASGVVELEHLKRRSGAGPMLKAFYLDAKLISVDGYQDQIPIVTGPKADEEVPEKSDEETADKRNARTLVTLMMMYHSKKEGVTRAELEKSTDMKRSTFYRAHTYAAKNGWLVKRGKLYNLNSDKPWDKPPPETPSASPPVSTPSRGVETIGGKLAPSIGGALEANWRLEPSSSCENADTTASTENSNQIKESESSIAARKASLEETKKALRKIIERNAAAGDTTAQAALERDAAHDAVQQLLKGKP